MEVPPDHCHSCSAEGMKYYIEHLNSWKYCHQNYEDEKIKGYQCKCYNLNGFDSKMKRCQVNIYKNLIYESYIIWVSIFYLHTDI